MSSGLMTRRREAPARGDFLVRVIAGHLVWCLVWIAGDLAARILVPDPAFVPFWYLSLIPLGYVATALVFALPSLLVALISGVVARRLALPRHLATFAVAGVCGGALVAVSATSSADPAEVLRMVLTVLVAWPAFAVLVPLPIGRSAR